MGAQSSRTVAQASDVHESSQCQMSVDEFCQWILSGDYRRYTTIRRVDLVKSTQARHAFHESLMFHVYGALEGGEKRKDKRLNDKGRNSFGSWRIIMERAGTIPQESQQKLDISQMSVAEASKFTPLNPGPAEDRVIIMPCPMAPTDPSTLPFMKNRTIIKTLIVPDDMWYLDRARAEREVAARHGRPVPPSQIDFNVPAASDLANVDSLPLLQPLCLALESTVPESKGYRLLATNCYFFARSLFNALELTYAGKWEHLRPVSDPRRHVLETTLKHTVFAMKPEENYKPLQKAALYLNGRLSGTSEMGELIRRTALSLSQSMENTKDMGALIGDGNM